MKTILGVLAVIGLAGVAAAEDPAPAVRPFRMGLSRWPADLTVESFLAAQAFAHEHGDIVSVPLTGGVPWPEALQGRLYAREMEDSLKYRPPAGKKLFVSITPLDGEHRQLAAYRGERENMALPREWAGLALNSPNVKKAYAAYALRVVQAMNPDYLALAVEANQLLSKEPARWAQFKELYADTYAAVKARRPRLPVFFTTDVLHLRGLAGGAEAAAQADAVADLMKRSDLFAMSLFPHLSPALPRPLPDDFLDFATTFGKPVAVAGCGFTSRDVPLDLLKVTLRGSDADQAQFLERLLQTAKRRHYEFVIHSAGTDYDRLCARLPPPLNEIALANAFTGLQAGDGQPKSALAVWTSWEKARFKSAR